jgi:hypothetical protein
VTDAMAHTHFHSLVMPKDDAAPLECEDRVLVLPPDFAAVIDGATDVSGQRFAGKTGGALAAAAIAAKFAQAWADFQRGGPDLFARAADAVALANTAIATLYKEFGLTEAVQSNPALRFRAAFAVASLHAGLWRGVGAGDCALRFNTDAPITRDHPAEAIFAAWRAQMLCWDPSLPDAEIRVALLAGLEGSNTSAQRAGQAVLDQTDPKMRHYAHRVLCTGLTGIRAALPGDELAFGVVDGVGDLGNEYYWEVTMPAPEVAQLALWTDGWLAPGEHTLESWHKAARDVHAQDARRIGPYRCLKGPGLSGRHDDMGLVLLYRA